MLCRCQGMEREPKGRERGSPIEGYAWMKPFTSLRLLLYSLLLFTGRTSGIESKFLTIKDRYDYDFSSRSTVFGVGFVGFLYDDPFGLGQDCCDVERGEGWFCRCVGGDRAA